MTESCLNSIDWKFGEFQFRLIKLKSSSIWAQKFVKQKQHLEIIEKERLLDIIIKNTEDKLWQP